jgi:HAD superfamily hydrolase (TIGR01484 family)
MARPVVCFDLDGTLIDPAASPGSSIHPEDILMLAQDDPPALFIPATGRSRGSVRRTFAENGLFEGQQIPLPLVLQNGALLYLPGEVEAAYFPFSWPVQEGLIRLAADFPQITFLLLSKELIHLLNPNSFGLEAVQKYEFAVQDFDPSSQVAYSKVMCISNHPEALASVAQAGQRLPVEGAYSMPSIFEFNPRGVSKASGVIMLLEKMGLAGSLYFAAGDGDNDRVLLESARLAFAPSSSSPEIRQLADYVLDGSQGGLLGQMLGIIEKYV